MTTQPPHDPPSDTPCMFCGDVDPDHTAQCEATRGPSFDGYGAPITTSTHELEDHCTWSPTLEQPGETWCRCTCGEQMDSIGSAGGPALPIAELFQTHLDHLTPDDGADCGEAA